MGLALVGTPSGDCLMGTSSGDFLVLLGSPFDNFPALLKTPFGDPIEGAPSPDFHVRPQMRTPLNGHSCWWPFRSYVFKQITEGL